MSKLEQLLEQEQRFERPLVFYSVSIPPPAEPPGLPPGGPCMPFSDILTYADHLSKQYGVPSPSVKPEAPSTPVSPETFNPVEVLQAINKPYKSILSEEETAYATILSKQFNVPSPVIEQVQVSSNSVDPKTFDLGQALIAVNDFTHDSTSNNPTIQSSSAKPIESYIYNPPEFKTSEPAIPKFEPVNTGYKEESFSNTFSSKPYRYLDNFSKNEVKILMENNYTKSDFSNALSLFKNNELPNIYKKIEQNLHMKPKSVTKITLTNPLYTNSANEEGPVFIDRKEKEIKLPITQPKFIPFIKTDQQTYRDIVLNSFLPHEQAHANINKKYGDVGGHEGLIGFNEHLADTMAKDSLGKIYTKAETEFQNLWVGSSEKKSCMVENYHGYLLNEDASRVPAHVATINILENPLLKKETDNVLSNSLEKLYPNDGKFREEVLKDIYGLSKIYQTNAFKITELSKKDTILSSFKAKRVLSEVEKYSLRFMDKLK